MAEDRPVRLDKWLWAARFFKTRGQAQEAIAGGKVHMNGQRAKPSRAVKPGDRLEVTKGPYRFDITVRALADRRGPASTATELYVESEASIAGRESTREALRLERSQTRGPERRPDKRGRRHIIRFTRRRDS